MTVDGAGDVTNSAFYSDCVMWGGLAATCIKVYIFTERQFNSTPYECLNSK